MTFLKWVAVVILMVALPMTVAAQSDSGRISGTVLDQTSAYVTGATVLVRKAKTGDARTATPDDHGHFLLSTLRT